MYVWMRWLDLCIIAYGCVCVPLTHSCWNKKQCVIRIAIKTEGYASCQPNKIKQNMSFHASLFVIYVCECQCIGVSGPAIRSRISWGHPQTFEKKNT